jgi:hypothetical protein
VQREDRATLVGRREVNEQHTARRLEAELARRLLEAPASNPQPLLQRLEPADVVEVDVGRDQLEHAVVGQERRLRRPHTRDVGSRVHGSARPASSGGTVASEPLRITVWSGVAAIANSLR